jgi:hypothetical protein
MNIGNTLLKNKYKNKSLFSARSGLSFALYYKLVDNLARCCGISKYLIFMKINMLIPIQPKYMQI